MSATTDTRDDRDEVLRGVDLPTLLEQLGLARGLHVRARQFPCPSADHDQTGQTPPVSVHTGRAGYGLWKCHACGAGGTAIDALLAAGEARNFAEALAHLRGERGVQVAHEAIVRARQLHDSTRSRAAGVGPRAVARQRPDPGPREIAAARRQLTRYVQEFQRRLRTPEAAEALAWLHHDRGLTDEEIDAHRIGYEPGYRSVRRPYKTLPASAGPAIMLPQLDDDGNVIYAQARPRDTDNSLTKYLNPFREWIGPNPRVAAIRSPATADRSVLVASEGLLDGILGARVFATVGITGAGLPNADVARYLVRVADGRPIVVCFDDDITLQRNAGQLGGERLVELLFEHGAHGGAAAVRMPLNDITDLWKHSPAKFEDDFRMLVTDAARRARRARSMPAPTRAAHSDRAAASRTENPAPSVARLTRDDLPEAASADRTGQREASARPLTGAGEPRPPPAGRATSPSDAQRLSPSARTGPAERPLAAEGDTPRGDVRDAPTLSHVAMTTRSTSQLAAARRELTRYVDDCRRRLERSPAGARARKWLHDRGLTDHEIAEHRIGYDPGRFTQRRAYRTVPAPAGPAITVPLLDDAGKVIYAQARVLDAGPGPKYLDPHNDWIGASPRLGAIHSPATADRRVLVVSRGIFDGILLGRHVAARALIDDKPPDQSVVERLMAAAAGRPIITCFRPDSAGRECGRRLVEMLRERYTGGAAEVVLSAGDPTDIWRRAPGVFEESMRSLVTRAAQRAMLGRTVAHDHIAHRDRSPANPTTVARPSAHAMRVYGRPDGPPPANPRRMSGPDPLERYAHLVGTHYGELLDQRATALAEYVDEMATKHEGWLDRRCAEIGDPFATVDREGALETLRLQRQQRVVADRMRTGLVEAIELIGRASLLDEDRQRYTDGAEIDRALADPERTRAMLADLSDVIGRAGLASSKDRQDQIDRARVKVKLVGIDGTELGGLRADEQALRADGRHLGAWMDAESARRVGTTNFEDVARWLAIQRAIAERTVEREAGRGGAEQARHSVEPHEASHGARVEASAAGSELA
jgi:DNA primase